MSGIERQEALEHDYDFDPAYGYTLERLLAIEAPEAPDDFSAFWTSRYEHAVQLHPRPAIKHTGEAKQGFEVFDLSYRSTDGATISGWLLVPQEEPVVRGIVVGHGYGGRDEPDFWCATPGTALMFPCSRGLSRSHQPDISTEPYFHVLHHINDVDRYVLGACVEDLWLAVSAFQHLFPATIGRTGYCGTSFGGGIGALALPWDERIKRAHFNVPTFGNHPLRLSLPTVGSGEAVRDYEKRHGNVLETLKYYDAATAAQYIKQPVHVAAALFDPAVAPPGQFSIYNELSEPKTLYVLEAGHFEYPNEAHQALSLREELEAFFQPL